MAIKRIQSTFIGGIHTDSLNSAVHLEQYYTGLKDARNVMITPQGSIKRRMGTNLLQTMMGNDTKFNLVEFSVKDNLKLILIFGNNNLHIFTQNGSIFLESTAFFSPNNLKYSTYRYYNNFVSENFGNIDPNELDFAQSLNSLIITHKDIRPQLLFCENIETENEALDSILIKDLEFRNIPKFDFEDELSPQNSAYQKKFSIQRKYVSSEDDAESEYTKNKFRFSLNGEISNWIEFGGVSNLNYMANRVKTYFHLSYSPGNIFYFNLVDRKSGYEFKNKKIIDFEVDNNSNTFDKFKGYKNFIYNGGSASDFLFEFSIQLCKNFFYETYDIVLKDSFLRSLNLQQLPIYLEIESGGIEDMIVGLNFRTTGILSSEENVSFKNKEGNLINDLRKFYFNADGDYYISSPNINKTRVVSIKYLPAAVNPQSMFDTEQSYLEVKNNNSDDLNFLRPAPHDIIFKMKKEIEDIGIISDLRNVIITNGIYGLFAAFGGGNCGLGSSPHLNTSDLKKDYEFLGLGFNGYGLDNALSQEILSSDLFFDHEWHIRNQFSKIFRETSSAVVTATGIYVPEITTGNYVLELSTLSIKIKGIDSGNYQLELDVGDGNENLTYLDFPFETENMGSKRSEDSWSNLRGWPSKCLFIENRLIFANTKELPNAMWLSEQDNFFSFKEGGNPQDAINNLRPTQTTLNQINHLSGNKSLQVFTSGSEHYNPNQIDAANISLPQQSNFGTYENIKPVFIDNATFYFDRNRNLRQFIYDDLEVSYKSENASILCPELINKTDKNKVLKMRAAKIEDSNYVFLLRENGSIICYQTIREQNIRNFVVWDSPDVKFNDIIELDGKIFGIAEFKNKSHIIEFNKNALSDLENNFTLFANNSESDQFDLLPIEVVSFYNGFNCIFRGNFKNSNYFIYLNEQIPGDLDGITTIENYTGEVSLQIINGSGNPVSQELNVNYYKNLGNQQFTQIGLYFESSIETKDIAYDIGRGQELVGKKKFNRAWISLRGSAAWYLQKNNFVYKPRGYIGESFYDFAQRFSNFTDDTEIRLTGYHNRINMKLTQAVPSYGEIQALTLEIKV